MFVPIRYNFIIFNHKGEQLGRYVSYKRFHQSVVIKDRVMTADPNGYFVYVQFEPNDTYENDEGYQNILIDCYCKPNVEITLMDFNEGMGIINPKK